MIRIRTLGGLNIDAGGRDFGRLLARPHQSALFVYLAVERVATRTELIALLWPHQKMAHARRSLVHALDILIDTIGDQCIEARNGTLVMQACVEVDVHHFNDALASGATDRALALYQGAFLEGFHVPGAPLFDRWVETRREQIRVAYERARDAAPASAPETTSPPSVPAALPTGAAAVQRPVARFSRLLRLVGELQRRRVFRVAAAYSVAAFVIAQTTDLIQEPLLLPEWTTRLVLIVLLLGFPVAIGLAWLFELTAEGELRWEEPVAGFGLLEWAGRSPWRLMGIAALVSTVIGTGIWSAVNWPDFRTASAPGAELEDARYVIFPFETDGTAVSPSGRNEAQLIYDALSHWSGIETVDLLAVRDTLASRTGPLSGGDAQRLARGFGAGRFFRGAVDRTSPQIRLYAALHDTRTGALLADTTLQYPADAVLHDSAYFQVATLLLVRAAGISEVSVEPAPGTRSFPAYVAFLWGHEARQRWDLEEAESEFVRALELDPDFARAALWWAQVQSWLGRSLAEYRVFAERASAARATLTTRERLLAEGLVHLARGELGEACARYTTLRQMNELDFAAWYGLGECHAHDRAVVPDAASPSGWSFRSSYHQAVEAYRRGFTLLPSAHRGFRTRTFERIRVLFFTSTDKPRTGRGLPPDTAAFLALPGWAGDTLAFTPYPMAEFAAGRPGTRPASLSTAVERQRRIVHDIASSWVRAFPRSPDATEALAVAQELLGDQAALETLRRARALAETPDDDATMAAREVTLLVKFGTPDRPQDLERARALADTLLTRPQPAAADHAALAIIAAFSGHVFAMATLQRDAAAADAFPVEIPVPVTAPAAVLRAYAAMGGPRDSIAHYESLVEAAISNRVPRGDQAVARHHLFDLSASLAFPHTAIRHLLQHGADSRYQLLQAQAALARGDSTAARRTLAGIRDEHRTTGRRPAELTLDVVFPQASLLAALRDTAAAVAALDSTLESLRWSEPASLSTGFRAASLMWAMALRAELAAATGDAAEAARWARVVAILWAGADPPLEPTVARMQAIVELGSRFTAATRGAPAVHSQRQTRRR